VDEKQDGPVELRARIDVEAPVERVGEALCEVELWPEWAATVAGGLETMCIGGSQGLGCVFESSRLRAA
jgi:uncharacterized protein YndB with AHSA1/START domain